MSNRIKFISILYMSSLLVACSTNIKNSEEETKGELTVLTVEFYSRAPVPDLLISIVDVSSGQEIDTVSGSIEGVAVFKGLQEGRKYKVTATSKENTSTGESFPSVEEFLYKDSSPYYVVETHATNYRRLAIPKVLQNPELPNGCEITSLTAVLKYYGLQMSKTEMTDKYLPLQAFRLEGNKKIGADPNVLYTGSPYEKRNGTYVFAKPIAKAANEAIDENNLSLKVSNISGQSSESILKFTEQGIPVIVWVTLDLSKPRKNGGWIIEGTNEYHEMYQNLHSVVLIGQTEDKVIVMDPLKGYVEHNKQQFFKSYVELGKQAVAIHK